MRSRGFTLIEMLIVISIIGLIMTIVLASLGDSRTKALNTQTTVEVRQLVIALRLFYEKNGSYPLAADVAPFLANVGTNPDLACTSMILSASGKQSASFNAVMGGFMGKPPFTLVNLTYNGVPYTACPLYKCATQVAGVCTQVKLFYAVAGTGGQCLPGFTTYTTNPVTLLPIVGGTECVADPYTDLP